MAPSPAMRGAPLAATGYLSGPSVAPPGSVPGHSIFEYTPGALGGMPSSVSVATAEIVANQSQDYVDEQLLEYQNQIQQLQGRRKVRIRRNTKICHTLKVSIGKEFASVYLCMHVESVSVSVGLLPGRNSVGISRTAAAVRMQYVQMPAGSRSSNSKTSYTDKMLLISSLNPEPRKH